MVHKNPTWLKQYQFKKGHKINIGKKGYWTGRKRPPFSEGHKRRISKSMTGDKNPAKRPEVKEINRIAHLGKKASSLTRNKESEARKGIKHWNWQGGKTSKSMQIRNSKEYKLWRESVFRRDNYTCIWCGQVGGMIHADHIKPFSIYPELRFAIDNGRTLCLNCHKKTDTYLKKWNQI